MMTGSSNDKSFELFIALDGNGLDGFEGLCGVARLRCDPDRGQYDIQVRYFDGVAGGHALQLSPDGKIGFLGNLSQQLLLFDPHTLEEIDRISTLRFVAPELGYQSQTHAAWLTPRTFVSVLGPDFYLFDVDDLAHPTRLGPHGVTLPHALKRSPSGRSLYYGAMDHDRLGYAKSVGVFDLHSAVARTVRLPATAWHLGVHPTRDVFYAPTQRCRPQGTSFGAYAIDHTKNYLFEIDGASAQVTRHLALPRDFPASLTSDVVVTEDHVLYNACAASVVLRVGLERFREIEILDERAGLYDTVRCSRAAAANLVESMARVHLPGNTDVLVQALRATRGSLLDGSYGLQLSPDRRFLLSAHRGLNEVRVYHYPQLRLVRRIRFPSLREILPKRYGRFSDPRLGFHHTAMAH